MLKTDWQPIAFMARPKCKHFYGQVGYKFSISSATLLVLLYTYLFPGLIFFCVILVVLQVTWANRTRVFQGLV